MTQDTFKRREFIASVPVAFAATAIPVEAAATANDPVAVAWERLKTVSAEFCALVDSDPMRHGNFDTPECVASQAEQKELEDIIVGTVPSTPAGVRAQLEWLEEEMTCFVWEEVHTECLGNLKRFFSFESNLKGRA